MLSTESRGMETKPPLERLKRKRSEIEYVEDYLDDKLVEMAQAYSDYGVLEDKKENIRNDKHPATNNKLLGDRVKLSADASDATFRGGQILAIDKETAGIYYPFWIQNKEKTSTTGLSSGIFRILGK